MKRNLIRRLSALLLSAVLTLTLLPAAQAARFTDVPAGHWAAESISRCADLGFFRGKSATRFGLGESMSRSAFAVVLTRFFGWEIEENRALPFTDVPADAWYVPALSTAMSHGAITGQSDRFRPGEAVTREELAVALVRGLGYAPLAGMAQQLELPFTDVATNKGYITMAYDLGLVNGTSDTTFSPEKPATREQVAVILMRLHDKLETEKTQRVGVLTSMNSLPDVEGFTAVALGNARLLGGDRMEQVGGIGKEEGDRLRKAGVANVLLRVTCAPGAFASVDAQSAAEQMNVAMAWGGYDGLFLDFPGLDSAEEREVLSGIADKLGDMLTDKLLYIVADAPCIQGHGGAGYDYKVLGHNADRLVLRVHSHVSENGRLPVAPVEPLEEIYYALRNAKEQVSTHNLALWMTTQAVSWENTKLRGPITREELAALLAQDTTNTYYSQRYGCSYLVAETKDASKDITVWYPDSRSAEARARLSRLFGCEQVVLGELSGMDGAMIDGLK